MMMMSIAILLYKSWWEPEGDQIEVRGGRGIYQFIIDFLQSTSLLPASYLLLVIDAEVFTNCKTNYKINYRIRSQYRYVRKQPRSSIQIFAAVIIKKVVLWMIHLLATKNRAILAVMMNHQSSFMIVMMVMWWCWCRWQRWWWWTLEKDQTRSVIWQ